MLSLNSSGLLPQPDPLRERAALPTPFGYRISMNNLPALSPSPVKAGQL
jgi:hypothetical protein